MDITKMDATKYIVFKVDLKKLTLTELTQGELTKIAEDFCDNYCKYPMIWDAEKVGMELMDSDICKNCPMSRI